MPGIPSMLACCQGCSWTWICRPREQHGRTFYCWGTNCESKSCTPTKTWCDTCSAFRNYYWSHFETLHKSENHDVFNIYILFVLINHFQHTDLIKQVGNLFFCALSNDFFLSRKAITAWLLNVTRTWSEGSTLQTVWEHVEAFHIVWNIRFIHSPAHLCWLPYNATVAYPAQECTYQSFWKCVYPSCLIYSRDRIFDWQ